MPPVSESAFRAALFAAASLAAVAPAAQAQVIQAVAAEEAVRLDDVTIIAQAALHGAAATKTDTPVIETPQSISVISAELLQQRGALTLQDALLYTAGMRSDNYGLDGRIDGASVRGATPAQFLDGMRTAYGVYNAARPDPWAMSSIEVVRGPSSVLYGQGTVAGVVNMNSKRPLFERQGQVVVSYGSFDRKEIRGDYTAPIDEAGRFAFRIVGLARRSNTQVDYVKDNRWFLSGSLTWRPTEKTEATLLVHHQEDHTGSTTQFMPWEATLFSGSNPNGRLPTSRFQGEPDWESYQPRQTNVSTFVRHELTDWLEFRQNARSTYTELTYQTMYPNSYSAPSNPWVQPGQPGYTGPKRSIARYISSSYPKVQNYSLDNQLQAKLDTGPISHTLVGGADGQRYRQTLTAAPARLTTPIDLYAPVYGAYVRPLATPGNTTKQSQLGFYLQDQIKIGGLNILAGLRRDKAKSWTITPAGVVTRTRDTATTYRVGALYAFRNGLAPYVSYAESFLPVAGTNLAGVGFKPQMGKQWEVGVKYQPTPNILATVAAYDLRDTNRVTPSPTNPLDRVQTGEVKSTGFEAELQATIRSVWTVTASYTYIDAKVSKSNNPIEVGKPLASVAPNVANAWLMRRFDLADGSAFRFGVGVRYVDESKDRNTASPPYTLVTPSYTLADLLASYERDNWRFSVNANNLFDKAYYSTCLTRGDCFIGARRMVIGSIAYRF